MSTTSGASTGHDRAYNHPTTSSAASSTTAAARQVTKQLPTAPKDSFNIVDDDEVLTSLTTRHGQTAAPTIVKLDRQVVLNVLDNTQPSPAAHGDRVDRFWTTKVTTVDHQKSTFN